MAVSYFKGSCIKSYVPKLPLAVQRRIVISHVWQPWKLDGQFQSFVETARVKIFTESAHEQKTDFIKFPMNVIFYHLKWDAVDSVLYFCMYILLSNITYRRLQCINIRNKWIFEHLSNKTEMKLLWFNVVIAEFPPMLMKKDCKTVSRYTLLRKYFRKTL